MTNPTDGKPNHTVYWMFSDGTYLGQKLPKPLVQFPLKDQMCKEPDLTPEQYENFYYGGEKDVK